jgi:hypothetical protein
MTEGTVKQAVIVADIVDTSILKDALKASGAGPKAR